MKIDPPKNNYAFAIYNAENVCTYFGFDGEIRFQLLLLRNANVCLIQATNMYHLTQQILSNSCIIREAPRYLLLNYLKHVKNKNKNIKWPIPKSAIPKTKSHRSLYRIRFPNERTKKCLSMEWFTSYYDTPRFLLNNTWIRFHSYNDLLIRRNTARLKWFVSGHTIDYIQNEIKNGFVCEF